MIAKKQGGTTIMTRAARGSKGKINTLMRGG